MNNDVDFIRVFKIKRFEQKTQKMLLPYFNMSDAYVQKYLVSQNKLEF